MQTKLIRKQVLIDQKILQELRTRTEKEGSNFNFSQYLRDLMEKDLQRKPRSKALKTKRLNLVGSITPALNSDPKSALNHNDIYDI